MMLHRHLLLNAPRREVFFFFFFHHVHPVLFLRDHDSEDAIVHGIIYPLSLSNEIISVRFFHYRAISL